MTKAALLLALLAFPCGGAATARPPPKLNRFGKPYKEGVVAPRWVDNIPEAGKGKLLAVGYSAPTYWPQDAINAAGEDARGKLALALTSHVEVLGMDTATVTAQGGAIINKEATDVVMQNSRIEATWTDENGDRSEAGGGFALASLEMDSIRGRASGGVHTAGRGAPHGGRPLWRHPRPGVG